MTTVIAMTREIGSRGKDVAAELAARLGLKIILAETVAASVAERLGVEVDAVLRYVSGTASLLERWRIDRKRLFHLAAEEILRLALQGNVLVKGWGAATLLRMERLGTADAAAVRAHIERHDAARARTLRAFFGTEQEDARLHHLVLNTERMSIEDCVTAMTELAHSPRFRNGTALRTALSNRLTEAQINAAFAERISPSMAPLGVSVSVADRRITLAGTSCNGSLRRVAERIAQGIAGTYEIDNRIVSVPSHSRLWAA